MANKARLTPKMQKFAREYVALLAGGSDIPGSEAARRAGYKATNAGRNAIKLLKHDLVRDYIASLSERATAEVIVEEGRAVQDIASLKPMPRGGVA